MVVKVRVHLASLLYGPNLQRANRRVWNVVTSKNSALGARILKILFKVRNLSSFPFSLLSPLQRRKNAGKQWWSGHGQRDGI